MTKDQLAGRLDHLDPGASITVPRDLLARMFDAAALSYGSHDTLKRIADFALEHRCTFVFHEHEEAVPCFQKDDVF